MASSLNRCEFIGNLGADPDIRYTQSGTAITNMSLACTREWKDKNSGQKQQHTEWIRISAFGKLAEICGQYLSKGSKIYISGRMQTRKWQTHSGEDRYSTEIVASEMLMLDSRGAQGVPQQATAQQYQQASGGGVDPSDDIPFVSVDWRMT